MKPIYYVKHPDGSFSAADPQPTSELVAKLESAVPDGFVLVPKNPSPEMIKSARWDEYAPESSQLIPADDAQVIAVWQCFLEAAPTPQPVATGSAS